MEFIITRTTGEVSADMSGVYDKEFTYIDERTFSDPSQMPAWAKDNWYNQGTNHRVENGHIKRDFLRTGRFISFDDLPALTRFVQEYERIVIQTHWNNPDILHLEIYDDYRE